MRTRGISTSIILLLAATTSLGQESPPQWLASLAKDPQSAEMREYARMRKERLRVEKELKRIRHQFFASDKDTPRRQEGLAALMEYKDSAAFESMVEVLACEGEDVARVLLNTFQQAHNHAGDSCIAWLAVYGCNEDIRQLAKRNLRATFDKNGEPPLGVKMSIYSGLRSRKESVRAAAAGVIQDLQIMSMIPWLIATQVSGGGADMGSIDRGDEGDLAWIAVGTQQSFVSDLTPVVGPSAVAFDPQLSVVTTGTLVRVHDAIVYEYHYEIHNPLVELTSSLTDTNTTRLGWDANKWNDWFANDFPKLLEAKRSAQNADPKIP